ncbi:MAG TPA: efflux RND transporter permease subunit [Bacteroidetes bacterium]|nr:efflux RND transporter permease subunit [Bacteroidota bacterium]
MNIPRLAIKNSPFTLTVFFLLTVFGVYAYMRMPRTENPSVYVPGGSIVVVYPGASPRDMEQLIAIPVEEAVNELDDIRKIETELRDGIAIVSVEFDYDTDAKEKYNELVRKVNATRAQLPDGISRLEIVEWTSSDVDIMQLAFYTDSASWSLLEQKAEDLKKMIEKVPGVKRVDVVAAPQQEIRISPDAGKMAVMHVSFDQIANAIRSNNANIPGGELVVNGKNFNLKTSGSYRDLDEIRNTVVQSYQGHIIYLKNIADVRLAYQDRTYLARYMGKEAVYLTVKQKDDYNIFTLKKDLDPILEAFRQGLPASVRVATVFDQSVWVRHRIGGFINNLLQGIVLVGIVILLVMGLRSSLIVALAIPLSLVIGLGFVDLSGYGLQQISIGGLVVALGLLVDNSIVVIENINRFIMMGYNAREASEKGSSQIAWPVVTATLTTLLAFIPIIMMPEKAGDFIRSLPLTILYTLTASLLIALTLTPLLTSFYFRNTEKIKFREGARRIKLFLQKMINGPYHKTLRYALGHRRMIIILSIVIFLGSLGLFPLIGLSFFPPAEMPDFLIRVQMPRNTAIQETDNVVRYVESVLDTTRTVAKYAANVGHGNPRIYYNIFPRDFAKDFGEVYVHLKGYDRKEYEETVSSLRQLFSHYTLADIYIKEYEQGVPVKAPVMIYVYGSDLDRLRHIAGEVERILKSTPGTINVVNRVKRNRTDIYFNINKDKALMLGVPVHEIEKTIRTALNGTTVDKFRDSEGKEYPIVVRIYDKNVKLSDLNRIYVKSLSDRFIPLTQLAKPEFRNVPGIITRYNMQRTILITADIAKEYKLDDVMKPVQAHLKQYPFPLGYGYIVTGELKNRNESFGGMLEAGIIALIAIFAVLVLQFKSFTQPLIIFTAIPLAVIGSLWALYLAGLSFSFTAFVGLVSLIGIVVNNSIILVDYSNTLRKKGKNMFDAVMEAGKIRFVPIFLTAFTTIGGLLPLTLQGGLIWAPLGWTIIGGLLVSTMLTLVVVPVLYTIMTK